MPTRTGPLTTDPGEPIVPDPMLLVPTLDWPFPLPLAMEDGIPIPSGLVLEDPGMVPLPVKEEKIEKVLWIWLGFELFCIPTTTGWFRPA